MRLKVFDQVKLLDNGLLIITILPIVHSLDFYTIIIDVRVDHFDLVASFIARIQIEASLF